MYGKRRRKKWYWLEEVRLECYGRMRSPEPHGGLIGDGNEGGRRLVWEGEGVSVDAGRADIGLASFQLSYFITLFNIR